MKKVVGIGNAILDRIVNVTEEDLLDLGLNKGTMRLVELEELTRCERTFAHKAQSVVAGGSCANTMAGLGFFGIPATFLGKVGSDALGGSYIESMRKMGVECPVQPLSGSEGVQTARCLVLVTPDAERTMLTHLGACLHLGSEDVPDRLLEQAEAVYLEAYMWDSPRAREALLRAGRLARNVVFSASDPLCVARHRSDFLDFISRYVKIVFVNEQEAMVLLGAQTLDDAIKSASDLGKIVVITRSEKGSIVVGEDGTLAHVDAIAPDPSLVDTTGAGDLYAAGFLYGLLKGMDLASCGAAGSLAASEVISHYGARPETSLGEKLTSFARFSHDA